jgi:hypothetical protein
VFDRFAGAMGVPTRRAKLGSRGPLLGVAALAAL